MQQSLPFDPNYYFGLVAENLLKNLGPKALDYADEALSKMKAIGDEEGFDLWLSIHEHLTTIAADSFKTRRTIVH
ncbi:MULTISPECIES: hypothetical protein [Kordiimonas]|jgi:hypothetical protein|uniref:Uncharacterized protein n=1 Tax=Kordiimonas lacus TaxID=637679 RepID=A0A1G7E3F5_9PROT|nr:MULTISPECIES: hypothetical protein [Kordiimonas]SDE57875.1 hypothetical protein SAMN04488071_3254 [Kordiimonas lacus]